MTTALTQSQQEQVAQKLVEEFDYLGVTIQAARICVASGDWDDHPLAVALRREAFLATHMRDNKASLL